MIERWLPSWTGNRPEELIKFYAHDAFYSDPATRQGLRGHIEILPYFKKLLARNPDWIWRVEEIIPIEKGFTAKWSATIPVGKTQIVETGLDIVEIQDDKVIRNEVYFDRTQWLRALEEAKG